MGYTNHWKKNTAKLFFVGRSLSWPFKGLNPYFQYSATENEVEILAKQKKKNGDRQRRRSLSYQTLWHTICTPSKFKVEYIIFVTKLNILIYSVWAFTFSIVLSVVVCFSCLCPGKFLHVKNCLCLCFTLLLLPLILFTFFIWEILVIQCSQLLFSWSWNSCVKNQIHIYLRSGGHSKNEAERKVEVIETTTIEVEIECVGCYQWWS